MTDRRGRRAGREGFGEASLGEAQSSNPPLDPKMLESKDREQGKERTEIADSESEPGELSPQEDPLVVEETEAAQAEVDELFGKAPEGVDPAQRPVLEAGGGVAEGFEQAEDELIERAEHGDIKVNPRLANRYEVDAEIDKANAVYGDADHIESTEVVQENEDES